MNKAQTLFRSMFADEAEYLRFKLANLIIADIAHSVDDDGRIVTEDFIRVVRKDDNKHLLVADDKPSWVQYNDDIGCAVLFWMAGEASMDNLKREGGKPTKVSIDFGDIVDFTYGHDDTEEVLWEDLFPDSVSPDPESSLLHGVVIDTDIKDWSFLNRLKTAK